MLRARRVLQFLLPSVVGGLVIFTLVMVLGNIGLSLLFFLLLPMCTTVITEYRRLRNNRRELVLVGGVAFVYFGLIAGFELLTHRPPIAEYIVVTTTLALAVLFGPVRSYAQAYLEKRLGLRDTPAQKAVEAYASALREEIDLDRLVSGLFATLRTAIKPSHAALWLASAREPGKDNTVYAVRDDPFISYALQHPGIVEVRRLHLMDTPLIGILRQHEVEIVLPLASQGELLGLLVLGPRQDGAVYSAEERNLLVTLATQVAPTLRVAQLALAEQQQVRERERIEQELRTARMIQQTFLPKEAPSLDGWYLTEYYQPAREVGGDFYDFLSLPDGRLGVVIGDVTGKGIPAALLMTASRTMLRSVAQQLASPGEVLAQVNQLLRDDMPVGMFVTCFYAILDPESGRLRYANAGQDLPAIRRGGSEVGELRATGMPLGLLPDTRYEEAETALAPGDLLLFYSDGLIEAHNPEREMFGLARLRSVLAETIPPVGPALLEGLRQALATFTGASWEQEDDVTLVALQRLESQARP
jgi:serine phosphatase RsbU (regulator of sigma subunit)